MLLKKFGTLLMEMKGKSFRDFTVSVSVSLGKGNLNGATILLGEGLGRIKSRTD